MGLEAIDTIGNLASGQVSIGAGTTSSIMSWITNILWATIIIGGIFFMFYIFMVYKYKIPVITVTRTGWKFKNIRVKRVKEKGGSDFKYKLLIKKKTIPISENTSDFYIENTKGDYIPATFENFGKINKIKPSNMDFWLTTQLKESEAIYRDESFWDKNKSIIVSFVLITFAFVAIILIMEQMQSITSGLAGVADAFQNGQINLVIPPGN